MYDSNFCVIVEENDSFYNKNDATVWKRTYWVNRIEMSITIFLLETSWLYELIFLGI